MRLRISNGLKLGRYKLWLSINTGFRSVGKMVRTEGCYDLCGDGVHRVLFLDYDDFKMRRNWLFKQLSTLQDSLFLGNIYVFQTDIDSYHAVCFDMFSTMEINRIVAFTSCDDAFKENWKFDYVPRVLRLTGKGSKGKPRIIKVIHSSHNDLKPKSRGHIRYYEHLLDNFTVNTEDLKMSEKTGVWGIQYNTRSPEDKAELKGGR